MQTHPEIEVEVFNLLIRWTVSTRSAECETDVYFVRCGTILWIRVVEGSSKVIIGVRAPAAIRKTGSPAANRAFERIRPRISAPSRTPKAAGFIR